MKTTNMARPLKRLLRFIKVKYIYTPLIITLSGCNKLVNIPEPINSITTKETFGTAANATAAIVSIYNDMTYSKGNTYYASGLTTIDPGLSANELNWFGQSERSSFENENVLTNDGDIYNGFWVPAYSDIYMANACIEGLNVSTTLSKSVKDQLTGEAQFLRAFTYFYLVNLFGDVPLVTTIDFLHNDTLSRSSTQEVYQQIIVDLKSAQKLLEPDYSVSGGQRIRANSWAATALLARTYLYRGYWDSAEVQAGAVIGQSATYGLESDLNRVFLSGSREAILQWQDINNGTFQFATQEGNTFIPYDSNSINYNLTDQLLAAFEPQDLRRTAWIDSISNGGIYYYYPFKYQVRQTTPDNITENYAILRLAEQYLIRAEARAQLGINLIGAANDIDTVRWRAGLPPTTATSRTDLLAAVAHERQVEFFAEWGHRWMDLKRTGQTNSVLGPPVKPLWKPTSQLYPIPLQEQQVDPNLSQNPGYN